MKQIRVLLLSCGTSACYHLAKTLKENFFFDFYIIGTDINLRWLIPTNSYLDEFIQCPFSADKKYYDFIINICKIYNPNYLIPSFDTDQMLFYPENKDLLDIGVKSLGTPKKTVKIYKNKILMAKFLADNGFPIPKVYNDNKDNIEKDTIYFVKPKNGVGSIGIRKMSGMEILSEQTQDMIIQELCTDPEITLECFTFGNYFSSIARKRIASKSGVCTKALVFNDTELENIGKRFVESVDTPMYFNLQFMKNCSGQFMITDVNLRMPGGMSIGFAAGWDAAGALSFILKNEYEKLEANVLEKFVPRKIERQYIVRAYTDIITKKINRNIAFDFDGTLLDSRKRHSLVMTDVLKEFDLNMLTDDLVEFKSGGQNNVAWLNTKGVPKDIAFEIQKKWVEKIEQESYLQFDELYDGVFEVLKKLSSDNYLYLVTARKNQNFVMAQITALGIKQYFDEIKIVPPENAAKNKAEYLKSNSIDVLIGDTEIDQEAAELAGCEFIPVCYGFRSKEFWNDRNMKSIEKIYESGIELENLHGRKDVKYE